MVGSGTALKLRLPDPSIRPELKLPRLKPVKLVLTPLKIPKLRPSANGPLKETTDRLEINKDLKVSIGKPRKGTRILPLASPWIAQQGYHQPIHQS